MQPVPSGPNRNHGLSANMLKSVAIAAMLVDHIAWAFVPFSSPLGIVMHFVGRFTAPVMFFFLTEGYCYTRSKKKYALRLAAFALLSWPAFVFFEAGGLPQSAGGYMRFGVIYTLLLAFLAIHVRHTVQSGAQQALFIAGLVLLSLPGDWPLFGILFPLVFDACREDPKRRTKAALILAGGALLLTSFTDAGFSLPHMLMMLGCGLPIFALLLYNGQKGRGGRAAKWLFYVFYPLHLFVLGFLKMVLR